jgi:phosphatidylglycerol:prolipoprotein diacylglycerol transferase
MWPVLFNIGPVPVNSYGLMIAIGFLTALFFIQREAKRVGLDPAVFGDAAFPALFLGLAATRVLHIVMFPEFYSITDPIGWIAVWRGGLVFQGGPPVVIAYLYFYFKKRKVDFWKACDIVFPYVPLGHGIGRIGCFLKGCCYGAPTTVPWGIPARRVPWDITQPPTGSDAYLGHLRRFEAVTLHEHWSLPIHPTQLYSTLGLLTICGLLLFLRRYWNPFFGFLMPSYLVAYGAYRFIIEEYRGDHNPVRLLNLSDQQIIGIIVAGFGIALFFYLRRRDKQRPVRHASA